MSQSPLLSKSLLLICCWVLAFSSFAHNIVIDTSNVVYGCMDSTALNYDPNATVSNGSCIAKVYGCTDPNSSNYNPLANVNDGSCILQDTSSVIYGCMDTTALNYDPNATVSNGSCIAKVYGCTDPNSSNYNPMANVNDGSCVLQDTSSVVYGCMDTTALNYNPNATVSNGSCIAKVYGCTDPNSSNYNPLANVNDGSCTTTVILGCTNPNSLNYNPYATHNDSSCVALSDTLVFGCTDPNSVNYNSASNINNGSCRYIIDSTTSITISGCMDPLAYNYNGFANANDNSCLYKQIQINNSITIVKSELVDTLGSVVFENCVINYSLPVANAEIESLTYVSDDSVNVTWAIYQSDGKKTLTAKYHFNKVGTQFFVLTVSCSQNSNLKTTSGTAPKLNTFGDVAEVSRVSGVANRNNSVKFSLFPQPANNSVNIVTSEVGSLSIMNLFGQTVLTVEINSLNDEINLSSLTTGTYVYKYSTKAGLAVGKFIKQ